MTARPSLPFPQLPDLSLQLERLAAQVPAGQLTTYGDLARALGSRNASICVSKWAREREATAPAVASQIVGKGAVGERSRFSEFSGEPPLRPLEDWLQKAAGFVTDGPLKSRPRFVAGIDVAYPAPDVANAAAVLVDVRTKSVIHEVTIRRPVDFPYITGFLTFRELPAMLAACEALAGAARQPDVVMIDGQGRLHPHRGGVATGFAAASGLPTIGVAKSLLCGTVVPSPETAEVARVVVGDEHLGYALRGRGAPVYVSVGGWLSLDEALDVTLSLLTTTRLPIPTHRADRLSKRKQG